MGNLDCGSYVHKVFFSWPELVKTSCPDHLMTQEAHVLNPHPIPLRQNIPKIPPHGSSCSPYIMALNMHGVKRARIL